MSSSSDTQVLQLLDEKVVVQSIEGREDVQQGKQHNLLVIKRAHDVIVQMRQGHFGAVLPLLCTLVELIQVVALQMIHELLCYRSLHDLGEKVNVRDGSIGTKVILVSRRLP